MKTKPFARAGLLVLALLLIGMGLPLPIGAQPPFAQYYGQVIGPDGLPMTAGATVEARVGGVVKGSITLLQDGWYGPSEANPQNPYLLVQDVQPGEQLEFYVDGMRAKIYPEGIGPAQDFYTFRGMEIKRLDLSVAIGYPVVETRPATNIAGYSATLRGFLADLGVSSSVQVSFEWGTTTDYGNETSPEIMTAPGAFSATITGLTPSTTYHFRAKAVGDGMVAYGRDQTFTTATVVTEVKVEPEKASIAVGQTQQFTATAYYSDGTSADVTQVATWESSNPAVATISPTGEATGVAEGTTNITATYSGITSGPAQLTVTEAVPVGLRISPQNPSIPKGTDIQFTALLEKSDGTTENVTEQCTWHSSDENVATIVETGAGAGLATGVGIDIDQTTKQTTIISATYEYEDRTFSDQTTLTVTAAVLVKIVIAEVPPILAGEERQLTVTGTYSDDTSKDVDPGECIWASSDPSVARVSSTGLVTGVSAGKTTITATHKTTGLRATVDVTVIELPRVVAGPASDVGANSATLNGRLIDLGSATSVGVSFVYDTESRADPEEYAFEIEATPKTLTSPGDFSAELTGLTDNTTYYYRAKVVADIEGQTYPVYSSEWSFKTGARPPEVRTDPATNITKNSATLQGYLIDRGTATEVQVSFEYGTTPAYGNETSTQTMTASGPFTADISNLQPGTTYHFRAKAVSDAGTSYGDDMTFTTEIVPPTVVTNLVSDNWATSAVLNGELSDMGSATAVRVSFVWGTSSGGPYPNETPPRTLNKTGSFSATITGLTPGTTYYYKAKAEVNGTVVYGDEEKAPTLTTIAVTGPDTVAVGDTTVAFSAEGIWSDGSTKDISAEVSWSSSDPGIASIDPATRQARGHRVGTVDIIATRDGIEGKKTLTVTEATLQSITISPEEQTISKGEELQFTATGTYSDGTIRDITTEVTWESSNTNVASITPAGLARGLSAGTTTITASLGNISDSTTLTVTEAELHEIDVRPDNPEVSAGYSIQLQAIGIYSDGTTAEADLTRHPNIIWESSDLGTATVNGVGLVTTYKPGSVVITAGFDANGNGRIDAGEASGGETLTVTAPVLDKIEVTPTDPVVDFVSGNPPEIQFTATAVFSDDSTQDVTDQATWTSSDPGVATIAAGGLATAQGPGTATISATWSGITGGTTLTVNPDRTAPRVILVSPTDGAVFGERSVTVTGQVIGVTQTTQLILNERTINLTLDEKGNFSQGVSLDVGSNTIRVVSTDAAGNTGTSGTRTVIFNPERPTITITSPADGLLTNNASVTLSGVASGTGQVHLVVNGDETLVSVAADGTFSEDITLLEGDNPITAYAYATGHEGDEDYLGTSGTITVTLDTQAPQVEITSPAPDGVVATPGITVEGRVDDPTVKAVFLILNGGMPLTVPVTGGEFSQTVTLRPGLNTIAVVASDSIGNTSSVPINVTYDNVKPQVTVTSPANGLRTNVTTQRVSGQISDPTIRTATLLVNGSPQTIDVAPDGKFNVAVTLQEGDNTIEVRATDRAGNVGSSGVIHVIVDTTPPELTIGLSDPTESVYILVISDERLRGAPDVTVDGTSVTMTSVLPGHWVGTYLIPPTGGLYYVQVEGTDLAGNVGTAEASFAKHTVNTDGIHPTTVWTGHSVVLDIMTNGAVSAADVTVTQHEHNPAGNAGSPEDAPVEPGIFLEVNAAKVLRDNLKEMQIKVDYDPARLPEGTDESSLKLYLWNTTRGTWELVPDSGVNTEAHYVYGTVTHLSSYGVFGRKAAPPAPPPPAPAPAPAPAPTPAPAPVSGVGEVSLEEIITAEGILQAEASIVSPDRKAKVVIPRGTRALDKEGNPLPTLTCAVPAAPAPVPPEKKLVAVYDFGPDGATFDRPVTIVVSYDPAKLPEGVAEEELILARYNAATGQWEELEDIHVNTELNLISGKTTHFTQFAVLSPVPAPPMVRYTLSIAIEPEEAGKVMLSPEQPAEGYEAGTKVTLTAQPNPGYRFERWSGDVSGTEPTATLTMDSDKEVVAHFAVVERYRLEVSVEPEEAGKVMLSPEQPAEGYEAGTKVTLTAQPNPGYRFERWSGDVSGTEPTATLTMDSDKEVVAHFAKVVVVLPEVVATSPESGAKDVPVDAKISVTFSKPMDKASAEAAFSIRPTVRGSFSWADNTMTFSPEEKLAYGTKYTVIISTKAKDKEGNALAQPYTWSFTTVGKPFPWWIWVIIGVVAAAVIIGLAYLFLRRRSKSSQGVE